MKVILSDSVHVCELTFAKEILYRAGCGQRRIDGDNLAVYFQKDGNTGSFYVKGNNQESIATLMVDEGNYDGVLNREGANCFPAPWFEYVDLDNLLAALVRKLIPSAKYKPSPFMGAGRSQSHRVEQSIRFLKKWSKENATKRETQGYVDLEFS